MGVIHHGFIDVSWFLFGSDYKSRGCYRSMPLPCKQDIGGTAKVFQALVEKLEHRAKIQSHGKLVEKASVRQLLCQIADSFQLSALQVSHILPCKVGESLEPLPPDEIISQRCKHRWVRLNDQLEQADHSKQTWHAHKVACNDTYVCTRANLNWSCVLTQVCWSLNNESSASETRDESLIRLSTPSVCLRKQCQQCSKLWKAHFVFRGLWTSASSAQASTCRMKRVDTEDMHLLQIICVPPPPPPQLLLQYLYLLLLLLLEWLQDDSNRHHGNFSFGIPHQQHFQNMNISQQNIMVL